MESASLSISSPTQCPSLLQDKPKNKEGKLRLSPLLSLWASALPKGFFSGQLLSEVLKQRHSERRSLVPEPGRSNLALLFTGGRGQERTLPAGPGANPRLPEQ